MIAPVVPRLQVRRELVGWPLVVLATPTERLSVESMVCGLAWVSGWLRGVVGPRMLDA
jgi:hypothetical protein